MHNSPSDPHPATALWHDDPAWDRALSLAERRRLPIASPISSDTQRADRRLRRWRTEPPFTQTDLFEQRLAVDHLTEHELHELLGETEHSLAARHTSRPLWLQDIAVWLNAPAAEWQLPGLVAAHTQGVLLTPCAPLLNRAYRDLVASLTTAIAPPADPSIVTTLTAALFAQLPRRLLSMMSRTLVLELNVARVQGKLSGATPAARFDAFIQQLRQPEVVQTLFREYPVLARLLVEEVARWHTTSLEFATRLLQDQPILEHWIDDELPLAQISTISQAGDRHHGGRNVQVVQWSGGARLVYKPRSLAVDAHMQQLLDWLNDHGAAPPLKIVPILERGEYGWCGWVAPEDCSSAEQITRFYQRQGAYLALLYMLGATDLHAENIIAAGEHPIMIDVEALFQPDRSTLLREHAQQQAWDRLIHSVLSVGLLPLRTSTGAADLGVEIGGLGAAAGQRVPQARMSWSNAGTDTMQFVLEDALTPGEQNRPTLLGVLVDPLTEIETIERSFSTMYQLLIEQRAALLAQDGPLTPFASDVVRLIARQTSTYERLRQAALHPDVLRDALDRERLLDRLYADVGRNPALVRLIAAERAALQANDIPLFNIRPTGLDLWSGDDRIAAFVTRSGLECVWQQLQHAGPDDLAWQRLIIRSSMTTFAASASHAEQIQPRRRPLPPVVATSDQLLAAASRIGDRLHALSIRGQADATWIGLAYRPGATWQFAPLDIDLHSGLAGVVLFLAYLGAQTSQRRYTDLAEAALVALRRQIDQQRSRRPQIGALSGWGGIIYSLTHLGQLWHAPALLDEAEQLATLLPTLITSDPYLDVMDGAAGCALSLGVLATVRPTPALDELLRLCGERLRTTAQLQAVGWGWPTPEGRPLTGLSHGAAGIVWALHNIAAATGSADLAQLATAALSFERAHFVAERGNWHDLRTDPPRFMSAWCHGATGIGLSRLQMLPSSSDPQLRTEIATAVSTTLREGWGRSHALCHGDLGNLELLLQAGACGILADWQTTVYRLAARILADEPFGWQCGLSVALETPGLMVGLAGIGYGLLRLAAPTTVPALLTLAPPVPD